MTSRIKNTSKTPSKATSKKRSVRTGIRSMTGFGKASEKTPFGKITVEVKTLNYKGFSMVCNMFDDLFMAEEKMKRLFERKVTRGKVFIRVTRERSSREGSSCNVRVNEKAAGEYLKKIKHLQKKTGVGGDIEIRDIMALPGIIESSPGAKEQELWPYVEKALNSATDKLIGYREKEGQRLFRDFSSRLKNLDKKIKEIAKYEKQSVIKYRKRLSDYMKEFAGNTAPDKTRLESEVASFAKNCDIAEELTRLKGHVDEYNDTMEDTRNAAGRKLDFIAQEMQREANTIGSKSSDFRIAKAVIEIKSEIEKIREQIRNIE